MAGLGAGSRGRMGEKPKGLGGDSKMKERVSGCVEMMGGPGGIDGEGGMGGVVEKGIGW
jgi:hypothetical protein